MKKTRKGFTLVELLIVVAVLATLTGVMMTSVGTSTAKAKAATISTNVSTCVNAIAAYYTATASEGNDKALNAVMLEAIPQFGSYAKDTNNLIKYTLKSDASDKTDVTKWTMTVDFSGDPDKDGIREALMKVRGYEGAYTADATVDTAFTAPTGDIWGTTTTKNYKFKVTLYNGTISAAD